MARRKKVTTTAKTTKTALKNSTNRAKTPVKSMKSTRNQSLFEELKLNESYVSLLLGVVVVLVLSSIFCMVVKNVSTNDTSLSNTKPLPTQTTLQQLRTYTLKEGEGLWDVAVRYYGDGYKWVEIAKANNLTEQQANQLGPGAKVIVPELK